MSDDYSCANAERTFCIFCGNKADSREHFWGKWLQKEFSDAVQNRETLNKRKHFVDIIQEEELSVNESGPFRRGNPPLNLTLKVVCGKCNNGWMAKIQEEVIQHKSALFGRYARLISPEAQQAIINWFFLKQILIEATVGNVLKPPVNFDWVKDACMDNMTQSWKSFASMLCLPPETVTMVGLTLPLTEANTSHNYIPTLYFDQQQKTIQRHFATCFTIGTLFVVLGTSRNLKLDGGKVADLVSKGFMRELKGKDTICVGQTILSPDLLEDAVVSDVEVIWQKQCRRNFQNQDRLLCKFNHQTGTLDCRKLA